MFIFMNTLVAYGP